LRPEAPRCAPRAEAGVPLLTERVREGVPPRVPDAVEVGVEERAGRGEGDVWPLLSDRRPTPPAGGFFVAADIVMLFATRTDSVGDH
jgi:hypothetical protein